jgi:cytochrome c-type biogenesis protein CcsB
MAAFMIIAIVLYILSMIGYLGYLFMQDNRLHLTGLYLFIAAFICHTIVMGYEYFVSGHVPVHNLHGTLIVAGWAVACVFLVLQYRYQIKILGVFTSPLMCLILIVASCMPDLPDYYSKTLFNNIWLIFHIATIFIGEAAFALACGVAIFYLAQEHTIKNKTQGFFFKRLPSLELIDNVGYVCVIVGFTMLTVGLSTGLVYAHEIWGRFWSWDPKEVWSGISWLLYAALLHGRVSMGWRGRKAAIMCIIGFCVLLFTFFGVNFLLQGNHGEFTRF